MEYRTAKAAWADGPSGALDSNAHAQETRTAELQWRAISPKLLKAADELLAEFAPKLCESIRRFAAQQSRALGMAAGELQPLDKSLTPRNNTSTRTGVFKLPKKISAGIASASFGAGARTGISAKFASLGLGSARVAEKPEPEERETTDAAPSWADGASPSWAAASDGPGANSTGETAWGAPVSEYNPFGPQ